MILRRLSFLPYILILAFVMNGCNMPTGQPTAAPPSGEQPADDLSIATPLPPLPITLVSFRMQAPAGTPQDETIYLSILDEVTGLALNASL